jgi:hypothetical protein
MINDDNDKVNDDKEFKSTRQWMVGDGGDNSNNRGDGSKGRCNIEETMEAMAEATVEKIALAKVTVASTAEAMAEAMTAKTVQWWGQYSKDSRYNVEVEVAAT